MVRELSMRWLGAVCLAIVAVVGWSTVTWADEVFVYSGNVPIPVAGAPQFNRPGPGPTFAPSGSIVTYHVQQFEVNKDTTCLVSSVQTAAITPPNTPWDGDIVVYRGSFNPLTPATNAVVFNDDDNASGGLSTGSSRTGTTPAVGGGFAAQANTPYFVVTAGHSASSFGDFTNMISCNTSSPNVPPLVISHGSGSNLGTTKALLGGNRFEVSATGTAPNGTPFTAQIVQLGSDDSALFWFFAPTNWELLLKIYNFCSVSQASWLVFAAGTTTAGVDVLVRDTLRGGVAHVINPLNTNFTNQIVPIPGSCP